MADLKVAPPDIDGYRYRGHLGTGGFSEVFLYEDLQLGREVALKVLTQGASEDEARVMALVAAHTQIVDVYSVGVIDSGLPYLVMQLYSGPNFAQRLQSGPLRYPEVLQLGVQLCGAVEWAHRLGVIHRDIKPANILTSGTGRPGLSDFGISTSGGLKSEQAGVSLPWVPPEVLHGEPADELGDVYSLAATLFTLCTGHAPFVIPGGDNADRPLMARTLKDPPPSLDDPDAPPSLNSLLKSALSKNPASRPASAEAFGRALQAIEVELRLSQTPLEIPTITPTPVDRTNDQDATRARGVRVIDANPVDESTRARRSEEMTRARLSGASDMISVPLQQASFSGDAKRRVVAAPTPEVSPTEDDAPAVPGRLDGGRGSSRRWWLLGGVAAVAAVVVAMVVLGDAGGSGSEADNDGTFASTDPTLSTYVPKVEVLTLERIAPDLVRASWTSPDSEITEFVWTRCEDGAKRAPMKTSATTADISEAPEGSEVCVAVTAERDGATSEEVRATLP